MITNKEFVEYSQFSGNYYGTSIQELIANEKSGLLSVLDVDIRGVINLQKNNILKAKYIFIKTPTLQFLVSVVCFYNLFCFNKISIFEF